jgi:DNA-binding response OmpR family regulator
VWPALRIRYSRTPYINYLRIKVDSGFNKRLIHTARGVGYQISAENDDARFGYE